MLNDDSVVPDFCWEYPRPPAARAAPRSVPVWLYDPSGVVYEGVRSNPLEGVTATVLYAPTAEGPWQVWDADWFGQENPLVTGGDGVYAWDVPTGFWQVLWEKPGYEPARSAVLEVLPPHLDVDGGLVALARPALTSATASGGDVLVTFDRHVVADPVKTDRLVALSRADGSQVPASVVAVDAEAGAPANPKGNAQPNAGEHLRPELPGDALDRCTGRRDADGHGPGPDRGLQRPPAR